MKQSHRAKLFHAVMFVFGACEIAVQMALALVPVEIPKPGTLVSVKSKFVYVNATGNYLTKRFERGTVFLVVTSTNVSKRKYAIGNEIVKLTMLGPDNRLWDRAIHAHVLSSDFDVVKT